MASPVSLPGWRLATLPTPTNQKPSFDRCSNRVRLVGHLGRAEFNWMGGANFSVGNVEEGIIYSPLWPYFLIVVWGSRASLPPPPSLSNWMVRWPRKPSHDSLSPLLLTFRYGKLIQKLLHDNIPILHSLMMNLIWWWCKIASYLFKWSHDIVDWMPCIFIYFQDSKELQRSSQHVYLYALNQCGQEEEDKSKKEMMNVEEFRSKVLPPVTYTEGIPEWMKLRIHSVYVQGVKHPVVIRLYRHLKENWWEFFMLIVLLVISRVALKMRNQYTNQTI